jgi:hypothetical protein
MAAANIRKQADSSRVYGGSSEPFPFHSAKATEKETFPDLCLNYHWDPTRVSRWTLPQGHVELPQDPRPWTKVCMTYTTSAPHVRPPKVDDSIVFPTGGATYPAERYSSAIGVESALRRLDRPLGTCERDEYIPTRDSTLFRAASTVPTRKTPTTQFIEELALPKALLRDGPYQCRAQDDLQNLERSPALFNNPTKYDKYQTGKRAIQPMEQNRTF